MARTVSESPIVWAPAASTLESGGTTLGPLFVVEAEALVAHDLGATLSELGYSAGIASSGEEAFRQAAEPQRRRVGLSEIAKSAGAQLSATQPTRDIQSVVQEAVSLDADPSLPVVLEKLFGNAWRFKTRRPAQGSSSASPMPRHRGLLREGQEAGLDMAYAGKPFGAFQRFTERTSTRAPYEGTSIGPPIVQRIVHRHGWPRRDVLLRHVMVAG